VEGLKEQSYIVMHPLWRRLNVFRRSTSYNICIYASAGYKVYAISYRESAMQDEYMIVYNIYT